MYGGDLSWRNVGSFFARQGFNTVEGKAKIASALHLKREDFHDWGVYDQFLYKYILLKLKRAAWPQFIYAMTTNNHPPYELYKGYKPKPLKISPELEQHLRGDIELIQKRLYDYQYALDMAGKFLDAIKNGELAKNTVVVITADNNTIEGVMNYDNFTEESKKIPFYIYLPPDIRPENVDTSVPGSHKDLMATLYDLTLSDTEYLSVGSSLLDKTRRHCGLNESGIVISRAGAFMAGKPQNDAQRACDLYRRAAIAVTDYVVKSDLNSIKYPAIAQ
jgi:phosphoglycerol transferase MdoB-like AlkP superfamily enzyme